MREEGLRIRNEQIGAIGLKGSVLKKRITVPAPIASWY